MLRLDEAKEFVDRGLEALHQYPRIARSAMPLKNMARFVVDRQICRNFEIKFDR